MKTLYLLRHAKSDWSDLSAPDHDRTLNDRGIKAAEKMGQFFRANHIDPEKILCSTAVRTRETLDILSDNASLHGVMEYQSDIYEASVNTLLSLIKTQGNTPDTLLIIGHNPGLQMLGLTLAQPEDRNIYRELQYHLPTGALQEHRLEIESFQDIQPGCGHLTKLVKPKSL